MPRRSRAYSERLPIFSEDGGLSTEHGGGKTRGKKAIRLLPSSFPLFSPTEREREGEIERERERAQQYLLPATLAPPIIRDTHWCLVTALMRNRYVRDVCLWRGDAMVTSTRI